MDGGAGAPSVMLFTHMDQLGFVVRKIEPDGFIRIERLGGVPERALPSQAVLICIGEGQGPCRRDRQQEPSRDHAGGKIQGRPLQDLYIDAGFSCRAEAEAAGVESARPSSIARRCWNFPKPHRRDLGRRPRRLRGDHRGRARALAKSEQRPTVHLVFSVQEEFNLRGALTAAQVLKPDIAIQLDLLLATDTPDMGYRGDVKLGGGPAMSLYSFHGRGTLNGTIPHPALVALFETACAADWHSIAAQRSYRRADRFLLCAVCRAEASPRSIWASRCATRIPRWRSATLATSKQLTRLLVAGITAIDRNFSLDRDDYIA